MRCLPATSAWPPRPAPPSTHWGLEVLCQEPDEYSPVLTAVLMPPGHDADKFRKIVLDNYNMSLGSGLGKVAGKVFRIGHLGECNALTLMGALSGVEMGLVGGRRAASRRWRRCRDEVAGRPDRFELAVASARSSRPDTDAATIGESALWTNACRGVKQRQEKSISGQGG